MRLLFFLALCLLTTVARAAEDPARLRDWFRTAWVAAQIGEDQSAHEAALRVYVLYPYLQAARLRARLARKPDAETDAAITRFLDQHRDEPVARLVQPGWWLSLAERELWPLFLEQAPAEPADPRLRCHRLAAQLALERTEGLRDAALAVWLTGKDLPAACDPVFTWLREQDAITPERVAQRIQLALETGELSLARHLARELPQADAAAVTAATRLLESPQSELQQQLITGLPSDNKLVLEAQRRLARRDSLRALDWLEALRRLDRFTETERAQLTRNAAVGLAQDRRPEALTLFRTVALDATDAAALEWRARAALWAGDWSQALVWIKELPETLGRESRWRYWRARCLELSQGADAARDEYREILREREYYGFLAAERLGQVPDLRHAALAEDPALREVLLTHPAMRRAQELVLVGLTDEASPEYRLALSGSDAAARQQAALLAASWGWHQQAIGTLAELGYWDDIVLRYPLPYEHESAAAFKESGLPVDWAYAVLRQESLYNRRAASAADALGLLQLQLPTAQQVALRNRRSAPQREDLFEPYPSLLLGSFYLADLYERFSGRWPPTLAAYNAGPSRIPAWLPERPVAADIWIENIPFNETRTYVQRVLTNFVIFGWRRNGKPTALLPLLGEIAAPPADPSPPTPPSPTRGEGEKPLPLVGRGWGGGAS